MKAEEVITLFDSTWFSSEFFKKSSNPQRSSPWKENPNVKIQKKITRSKLSSPQGQDLLLTMISNSSKIICGTDSLSPDSVLTNLKTVFSDDEEEWKKTAQIRGGQIQIQIEIRRKKAKKSLSELEIEEVKGFIDLGFVFSEEDKNSKLVDIIPGLKKSMDDDDDDEINDSVERPYLSEVWEEELDKRKKNNALMEWRMPGFTNEMDMKSHLRKWARNVAATLR